MIVEHFAYVVVLAFVLGEGADAGRQQCIPEIMTAVVDAGYKTTCETINEKKCAVVIKEEVECSTKTEEQCSVIMEPVEEVKCNPVCKIVVLTKFDTKKRKKCRIISKENCSTIFQETCQSGYKNVVTKDCEVVQECSEVDQKSTALEETCSYEMVCKDKSGGDNHNSAVVMHNDQSFTSAVDHDFRRSGNFDPRRTLRNPFAPNPAESFANFAWPRNGSPVARVASAKRSKRSSSPSRPPIDASALQKSNQYRPGQTSAQQVPAESRQGSAKLSGVLIASNPADLRLKQSSRQQDRPGGMDIYEIYEDVSEGDHEGGGSGSGTGGESGGFDGGSGSGTGGGGGSAPGNFSPFDCRKMWNCKQVPREVIKKVKKCRPKQKCLDVHKNIPDVNCRVIPEKRCTKLPHPKCEVIETDVETQVPTKKCKRNCQTVKKALPKKMCTQIPRKTCKTVSRPKQECFTVPRRLCRQKQGPTIKKIKRCKPSGSSSGGGGYGSGGGGGHQGGGNDHVGGMGGHEGGGDSHGGDIGGYGGGGNDHGGGGGEDHGSGMGSYGGAGGGDDHSGDSGGDYDGSGMGGYGGGDDDHTGGGNEHGGGGGYGGDGQGSSEHLEYDYHEYDGFIEHDAGGEVFRDELRGYRGGGSAGQQRQGQVKKPRGRVKQKRRPKAKQQKQKQKGRRNKNFNHDDFSDDGELVDGHLVYEEKDYLELEFGDYDAMYQYDEFVEARGNDYIYD